MQASNMIITIKADTTQFKAAMEELAAGLKSGEIFKGVKSDRLQDFRDSIPENETVDIPTEPATGTYKHMGSLVIDIIPSDIMLECLATLRAINDSLKRNCVVHPHTPRNISISDLDSTASEYIP